MNREMLLGWYRRVARPLPWRATKDAYAVWISEVMSQQTRVETAAPYFERFMAAYPSVCALARADEQDVLSLWQGLGYYARARKLLCAAREIAARHAGVFPRDLRDAIALPGVGMYTAAAVLSIAYGTRLPAVDGNALRVFSRLLAVSAPADKPEGRLLITEAFASLVDCDAPGDVNQAVMELGATVCVPRGPRCGDCPLRGECLAREHGQTDRYPVLSPKKKPTPEDLTVAVVLAGGRVLLRKRPAGGLLASMWEFPNTAGHDLRVLASELVLIGVPITETAELPPARHVFTHRVWRMRGVLARAEPCTLPDGCVWADLSAMAALPIPAAFCAYREIAAREISENHHGEANNPEN